MKITRSVEERNPLGMRTGKYVRKTEEAVLVAKTPKGYAVRLSNGDVIHRKAKYVDCVEVG